MTALISSFGEMLRRYRTAAGLSQEALAERARLSPRAISDLERGVRRAPYQETVRLLADALRLAPIDRATLEATVSRRRGARPVAPAPPVATPAPASNLPLALTSFVGRARELADLRQLLAERRLLTLIGAGGVGKTRLALAVAAELLPHYADGVRLVDLASLAEPALVPQRVAAAVGVQTEPGRPLPETLTAALAPKRLLLVLDNCEHLVEACAQLVDALLQRCPTLHILATSRETLAIPGETVYRVPSLALPAVAGQGAGGSAQREGLTATQDSDAVRLFVERAQAALPSFILTEANTPAIVAVCRRLDGIPLALELAAARVRTLTVAQLAERLADCFPVLTGSRRTAVPRQQTLRATLDWSYQLLTAREQMLFRRLAVFAGGWTLEAAEGVCSGDGVDQELVLDLIERLTDKSLVLVEEQDGEVAWYRCLEPIRQYARERLEESGEAASVQGRHRDWYLALARQAQPQLQGAAQSAWFARLELEHDNLRAALAWSLKGGTGGGAPVRRGLGNRTGSPSPKRTGGSAPVSGVSGAEPPSGGGWGTVRVPQVQETGLGNRTGSPIPDGEAAQRLGASLVWFWYTCGYAREGDAWLRRALTHHSTPAVRAAATGAAAWLAHAMGDYAAGKTLYEESLSLYTELGNRRGQARVLCGLGNSARVLGDIAPARAAYQRSVQLFEAIAAVDHDRQPGSGGVGPPSGLTVADQDMLGAAMIGLGDISLLDGEHNAARSFFERALTLFQRLGDQTNVGWATYRLGDAALRDGDAPAAWRFFERALALYRETGARRQLCGALNGLGRTALSQGDTTAARTAYEESLLVAREQGATENIIDALIPLGRVAYYEDDLDRATTLLHESLTLATEIGYANSIAWSHHTLGRVTLMGGDPARAVALLAQGLAGHHQIGEKRGIIAALESIAAAVATLEQPERAARLLGAAAALRDAIDLPLPPIDRPDYDRCLAAVRAALDSDTFTSVWHTGRSLSLDAAVAEALDS